VLFLLFFAAAAPSPLYGVYQAQWRFSAITLTAVFAVYALLLPITSLVFGSVSDYLGRRRVILGRPGDGGLPAILGLSPRAGHPPGPATASGMQAIRTSSTYRPPRKNSSRKTPSTVKPHDS
jgi:MFS family permease